MIGGGNSAGQAALFLSNHVRHVHVLVHGGGLADSMSDYLVGRTDESPRIPLHPRTELCARHGDRMLDRVTFRNRDTGTEDDCDIANVFVMIGAVANTGWMGDCVARADLGFVLTRQAMNDGSPLSRRFRAPSPLATSVQLRSKVSPRGSAKGRSVSAMCIAILPSIPRQGNDPTVAVV